MSNGTAFEWTDQQWSLVQQTIYEEARRTRVAAGFLPLFGGIPADAETVPAQTLRERDRDKNRLSVDDHSVLNITTLAINVELSNQQISQPDLSAALTLFRRAANIIARQEDKLIFEGAEVDSGENGCKVTGGSNEKGLLDTEHYIEEILRPGQALMKAVTTGITYLEGKGYVAPFALVLGSDLFVVAETPDRDSMVLPSDRIRPLVQGPMVRSGTMPEKQGILLSLAGQPVEIVVVSDISASFLQVTTEPRWVFRVSERVVLRVKEPESLLKLIDTSSDDTAASFVVKTKASQNTDSARRAEPPVGIKGSKRS